MALGKGKAHAAEGALALGGGRAHAAGGALALGKGKALVVGGAEEVRVQQHRRQGARCCRRFGARVEGRFAASKAL